jgi:hypothetical protein
MLKNLFESVTDGWMNLAHMSWRQSEALYNSPPPLGLLDELKPLYPANRALVNRVTIAEIATLLAFSLLAWNFFQNKEAFVKMRSRLRNEAGLRNNLGHGHIQPSDEARFGSILFRQVMITLFVAATVVWWSIVYGNLVPRALLPGERYGPYHAVAMIYQNTFKYYHLVGYAWCMFLYCFVVTVVLLYYLELTFSPLSMSACTSRCRPYCDKHVVASPLETPISYETAEMFYNDLQPYFQSFPVFLMLGAGLIYSMSGYSLYYLLFTVPCVLNSVISYFKQK